MSPKRDSTLTDPRDRLIADLQRQLAECQAERDAALAQQTATAAERDEALAQQTATAEVLGVINSSPGDLAPVWDAMLAKATRLCDAASGILWTYDGSRFRAAAVHGATEEYAEWLHSLPDPVPSPSLARIVSGEKIVRDDDLATAPSTLAYAHTLAGMRTGFLVALRKGDALLGAIRIFRQDPRPFSDKHIVLVENFAAQAVIAMENARLINETREALEQQTATAEVLGVINSSPGDLAPVFDAILEKAHRLCGVARGGLALYDGEFFRVVALHGYPSTIAELMRRPFRALNQIHQRMVDGESYLHIPDVLAVSGQVDDPVAQAVVDAGVRTWLGISLVRDGKFLGHISASREEVRPFTDKEIALLESFAAQAVIAMENARLITETREALEQQTATAEVLGVINASPGDLAPVFDAMLEKATRLCEADFGILWIFDGGLATAGALHRVPAAYADMIRTPFRPSPESGPARMMRGDSTFVVPNLLEFPPYHAGDTLVKAIVDLAGARTVVISPLRKDGLTIGAITVYRQEVRPFTERQIDLLENFAAQAVIAMENARLITETREALEQQTATAEVLGVINSSPGDLAPVFEAILEKAHDRCGIAFGSLQLLEDGKIRAVAVRGVPGPLADMLRTPTVPGLGAASRLQAGEPVVQVADMADASQQKFPRSRAAAEHGMRTALFVPLRKGTDLLGFITAYRDEVRLFSEKEIGVLQNFAAQAVIAMENARLLGELRQRTDEVAELNRGLEARVAEQVDELGRVGRLKRFLAPQLAELIVSQGDEKILESHRREIVVVFCDLRGYTAFTETAEPEEVLDFLREYHGALGPLVAQFEGTLDQFSGDGIMVFFNDPVPIPDPAERAVKMAVAMREEAAKLIAAWRQRGRELGFGAGIAQGYATLGQIGFADRSGYTAIGTVCNVAARLCAEAKDGQILIGQRVNAALAANIATEQIGALTLKGLTQPVIAFNVPATADTASAAVSGRRKRAPKATARKPRITGSPA